MNKLIVAIASIGSLLQVATAHSACTDIAALPFTITQSGKYCLTQDLVFEGTAPIGQMQRAINVASNDVTVDLNGYTILGTGTAPLSSQGYGVYAYGRSNVTVTNGRIRGFGAPISLSYPPGGRSTGYVVEQIVIDSALYYGIYVFSENAIIRNNRVSNVAPGNVVGTPSGLYVGGVGMRILDNHVTNIVSTVSSASGIQVGGFGTLIQGNTVSNVSSPTNLIWGIALRTGSNNTVVKDNMIHNSTTIGDGISATPGMTNLVIDNNTISGFYYGINIGRGNGAKYRNNTAIGTGSAAPYIGGTDIGGNN